jgi:hypothetical protein
VRAAAGFAKRRADSSTSVTPAGSDIDTSPRDPAAGRVTFVPAGAGGAPTAMVQPQRTPPARSPAVSTCTYAVGGCQPNSSCGFRCTGPATSQPPALARIGSASASGAGHDVAGAEVTGRGDGVLGNEVLGAVATGAGTCECDPMGAGKAGPAELFCRRGLVQPPESPRVW